VILKDQKRKKTKRKKKRKSQMIEKPRRTNQIELFIVVVCGCGDLSLNC